MQVLKENPFPRGKLIKKIKGTKSDFYRLRVDKYRLFYMVESKKVVVLRNNPHPRRFASQTEAAGNHGDK